MPASGHGSRVPRPLAHPLCFPLEPTYSPRRVAEAIGVSESSLKRWADDGRLAVHRTVGGHRRIHRSEALRFVRSAGLRVERPHLLELALPSTQPRDSEEPTDSAQTLFQLLSKGNAHGVHAFLLDLYLAGTPIAEICDGPIRNAMSQIGELWHCERERGIVIEHSATSALLQGVASLRSVVTPDPRNDKSDKRRPLVLGGSPSGDPYLLPSTLTAWVLAEAGCTDLNLGPETPTEAFVAAIEDHSPMIAWVACSAPPARPSNEDLKQILRALQPHGGTLVIGGRGFVEFPPPPLPGLSFCRSMAEIRGFIEELMAASDDPPRPDPA